MTLGWTLVPLFLFGMGQAKPVEKILYDFINPSSLNGWNVFCDPMTTGLITGKVTFNSSGIAVFSGMISTEEKHDFCLLVSPPASFQLRNFRGVKLRIRGDGRQYLIRIYNSPDIEGVAYQAGFNTKKERMEIIFLPFSSFVPFYQDRFVRDWPVLDQSRIIHIALMVDDRQTGPFQLEIHWIKAIKY